MRVRLSVCLLLALPLAAAELETLDGRSYEVEILAETEEAITFEMRMPGSSAKVRLPKQRIHRLRDDASTTWRVITAKPEPAREETEATSEPAGSDRAEATTRSEAETGPGWPCWRGPDGSGVGPSAGVAVVGDLARMRPMWESEERGIPCNAWENGTQGGFDSPIVGGGMVILSWFQGAGEILDESIGTKGLKTPEQIRQRQAVATEDMVLAVDAATGRTRWKVVLDEGVNLYQRRKRGPHCSPCYRDGRVYAQSTLGKVYCLDAADGSRLWNAPVTGTAHNEAVLAAYKQAGKQHPYRGKADPALGGIEIPNLFMCPLQVAGGTVVAHGGGPDGRGGPLCAFAVADGRELWQKGCGIGRVAPVVFRAGDRELVLAHQHCLDPATGEEVWRVDARSSGTPVIGEGYAVYDSKQVVCYRISATAADRAWTLPAEEVPGGRASCDVIYRGHLYLGVAGKENASKLICVELASGKIVARIDEGPPQDPYSCLMAMGGRLFARHRGREGGRILMMNADPADFRHCGAPAGVWANSISAAVADGLLYTRGGESLFCYDLRARR